MKMRQLSLLLFRNPRDLYKLWFIVSNDSAWHVFDTEAERRND